MKTALKLSPEVLELRQQAADRINAEAAARAAADNQEVSSPAETRRWIYNPNPKLKAANDNTPDHFTSVPAPAMCPTPFAPAAAGGLIQSVAEWITATAIIPVPELSLAAAIALLAGMFGDRALGPTSSGVNLFITTLLPTAGGKAHPPKAVRALAEASGRPGAVTNGDPTSYAALERMLRVNSSTVISMDEFGITLQDVNAKHQSSPAASIRKFLLAIYDQANSTFDGRKYASAETKKDDAPIKGPALTVLAMTTPETLYDGLSENAVGDGFLNRFLFMSAAPPPNLSVPPLNGKQEFPPGMTSALRAAVTRFPRPPGLLSATDKFVIPFEGGEGGKAHRRWGEVFLWQHHTAWVKTERDINGRAAENTIRLASIRAISRSPAAPEVTVDDVEWGWAIVHQSIAMIHQGISRHMASSPADALRKSIVEALRIAPSGTLPLSKLMTRKGVSGAEPWALDGALKWLITMGEITDLSALKTPGRGSKFLWNGFGMEAGT